MLAEVQERCRECKRGAGRCRTVRAGAVQGGAGGLHHLHLSKHNIRCREVQAVQAHLRFDVSDNPTSRIWVVIIGLLVSHLVGLGFKFC